MSVLALVFAAACSAPAESDEDSTVEPLTSVTASEEQAAQSRDLSGFTFERATPTGQRIFKSALYWMDAQSLDKRYPRPRMCASNASKVFFLSGIRRYDAEGVRTLIANVRDSGGVVTKMPRDKRAFIDKLESTYGGKLPLGTLIAGMNIHSSNPGDQHIGIVGNVDANGVIWVYHNNWYRPENEGGHRKPYMISDENLRRGFPRQWMPTPWLKIVRDASGKIADVQPMLPAVDDMNPFDPSYQVTVAVIPEIAREAAATR